MSSFDQREQHVQIQLNYIHQADVAKSKPNLQNKAVEMLVLATPTLTQEKASEAASSISAPSTSIPSRRNSPLRTKVGIFVSALIILIGGIDGLLFQYYSSQPPSPGSGTATPRSCMTPTDRRTQDHHCISSTPIPSESTSVASVTVSPSVVVFEGTASPMPSTSNSSTPSSPIIDPKSPADPYDTAKRDLALSNDLTSAAPNPYPWDVTSSGKVPSCSFSNQSYDVLSQGLNYCEANKTNFSNFVYQIQLKIVQGQAAGIIFRTNDSAAQTYYIFEITVDGTFFVQRNDSSENGKLLYIESSPVIKTGFNQSNIIAVDANGSDMTFYINGSNVAHLKDTSYSSGLIGVLVGEQFNQSDTQVTTEATYNYAKVWI